jgi:hypothetical protein
MDEDKDFEDDENEPDRDTKIESAWSTLSKGLTTFGLDAAEQERGNRALRKGSESAHFAILLGMVPNLRALRFGGEGTTWTPWIDVLFRYTRMTTDPILRNLSTIEISHNDSEGEESIGVLQDLIFLSRLRTLYTHNCGDNGREGNWSPRADLNFEQSQLESVAFNYCLTNFATMLQMMEPMKALKALDYSNCGEWSHGGYYEEDEFRADFQAKSVPLLNQHGFSWRIGKFRRGTASAPDYPLTENEGFRVRCSERAHELDEIENADVGSAS